MVVACYIELLFLRIYPPQWPFQETVCKCTNEYEVRLALLFILHTIISSVSTCLSRDLEQLDLIKLQLSRSKDTNGDGGVIRDCDKYVLGLAHESLQWNPATRNHLDVILNPDMLQASIIKNITVLDGYKAFSPLLLRQLRKDLLVTRSAGSHLPWAGNTPVPFEEPIATHVVWCYIRP